VLGNFIALTATVESVKEEADVWLVCAGKLGRFALEDASCAGTIAARLAAGGATLANDDARLAATLARDDADAIRAVVTGCDHGRWLASLGDAFAADVDFCAQVDTLHRCVES
jgi:2-phosphosulfolactate phosphatase